VGFVRYRHGSDRTGEALAAIDTHSTTPNGAKGRFGAHLELALVIGFETALMPTFFPAATAWLSSGYRPS